MSLKVTSSPMLLDLEITRSPENTLDQENTKNLEKLLDQVITKRLRKHLLLRPLNHMKKETVWLADSLLTVTLESVLIAKA